MWKEIVEDTPTRFDVAKVYVVGNESLCKIGFSISPKRRHSTIETAAGRKLPRAYYLDGDYDAPRLERALHRQFEKSRSIGEWFDVAAERAISMAIVELTDFPLPRPSASPDAIESILKEPLARALALSDEAEFCSALMVTAVPYYRGCAVGFMEALDEFDDALTFALSQEASEDHKFWRMQRTLKRVYVDLLEATAKHKAKPEAPN